jgi:hypothetical protein
METNAGFFIFALQGGEDERYQKSFRTGEDMCRRAWEFYFLRDSAHKES